MIRDHVLENGDVLTAVKNNSARAEAKRQAAQTAKLAPAVTRPVGDYQQPGAGRDSGIDY